MTSTNEQNILQNENPHLTLTWDSSQQCNVRKGSCCTKERILIMLWGLNFACGQWKMLKSFHPWCVCVLEDNISPNNLTDHRGDLCHGLWLVSVSPCWPLIGHHPGTIPWPLQDHYNPFHFSASSLSGLTARARPPDTDSHKMGSHWN